MKLNFERETLLEPLQMVIGVVERRQTLPILANVLLTGEDTQLSITATDMEIELVANTTLPEPLANPIQITLSGRKLLDILRTLPEQANIDLQQDKERVIVRSGRSRFILSTLPVASFPRFETSKPTLTHTLAQKDLCNVLQSSQFAMAQQDVRYYLNGMLIDVKGKKICTVATDGHRFAMNTRSANTNNEAAQIILPRKGVLELLRLLKQDDAELSMEIGDNHMRVSNDAFTFTSRLIDGRFPDYENVLLKGAGNTVSLNREALRDALLRVSILSNEKFRSVRLQLRANFLHILANNQEQEEAEEILSIDYSGEEMDMAFNVMYLLDVLNTMTSENVEITFTGVSGGMFIGEPGSEDCLFLIMPLQV